MKNQHAEEVAKGDRFEFGENWRKFLDLVDQERIKTSKDALSNTLADYSLKGKTFLDIGSGSGLSSLAANRLGADVYSFDYDPESVTCTTKLRDQYSNSELNWEVVPGSILDQDFVSTLGQFDVVYSWGVLHHTGNMWLAIENTLSLVADDGILVIALYNDQGGQSRRWRLLKKIYNNLPKLLRPLFAFLVMAPRELRFFLAELVRCTPQNYFSNISNYSKTSLRGMNYWHDIVDWIGGYPFEVASPDDIFEYFFSKGFQLIKLSTVGGGMACNEYVFRRHSVD